LGQQRFKLLIVAIERRGSRLILLILLSEGRDLLLHGGLRSLIRAKADAPATARGGEEAEHDDGEEPEHAADDSTTQKSRQEHLPAASAFESPRLCRGTAAETQIGTRSSG
jgi:hypothetical protein